jgi:hypothetical protein
MKAEATLYKDMKLGETKVKAGTYNYICYSEKDSTSIY